MLIAGQPWPGRADGFGEDGRIIPYAWWEVAGFGLVCAGAWYLVSRARQKYTPNRRRRRARRNGRNRNTVERVRLDRGGYDRGGRYWGVGAPLYHVECPACGSGMHVRAARAIDARRKVGPCRCGG